MNISPFHSAEIFSGSTIDEIRRKLAELADNQSYDSDDFGFEMFENDLIRDYEGEIDEVFFVLKKINLVSNYFLPGLSGKIIPYADGSAIKFQIKLGLFESMLRSR